MAESSTLTMAPTPTPTKLGSRAVLRPIEAGSLVECTHCGDRVKFQAKVRKHQVICNIYVDGRWNRVEHYHDHCYVDADEPYGTAVV